MKKFKVGHFYEACERGYSFIEILKRTDKTVWVKNDSGACWKMRIRIDEKGNEFVIDSSVPTKWRGSFTYSAIWEENQA